MAKTTISIDPINRIEGHLKVDIVVDGGEVKDARCSGQLFRGFELMLLGRDPRDAALLVQRVCGVCPIAHATASALSLDAAFGIDEIPANGRLMRNLIFGANYIQSHILHFYHLAALDFVDVAAAADYDGPDDGLTSLKSFIGRGELAPYMPRYEGDYRLSKALNQQAASHYVKALEARRIAHEMCAIFGGKMPHQVGIVVGGCTETPTADKMTAFLSKLEWLRRFVDTVYLPDVLAVAEAYHGLFGVEGAAMAVSKAGGVDVGARNVMGVAIPDVRASYSPRTAFERGYGVLGTSAKIDEAAGAFEDSLALVIELAKTETALIRLLREIEKTKRRVNALQYVVLPRLRRQSKYISMRLDEMERETFFTLKVVKRKLG